MFQDLTNWFIDLGPRLHAAFVEGDRWQLYLQGLLTTLELTVVALIVGVVLGVVLITLVQNNLNMLGIPTSWQTFVVGLIILLGTIITSWQAKRSSHGKA